MKTTNTKQYLLGAKALALIAIGSALSPLVIIGLLGLLMTLVGLFTCIRFVSTIEGSESSRGKNYAGQIITTLGVFLLVFGCLAANATIAQYVLAGSRGHPMSLSGKIPMLVGCWLAGPAVIMAGVGLRTGRPLSTLIRLAFYWPSFLPTSVLIFWLFLRDGPLTA